MKHPFDGDGMVMAISFSEKGAYFRNRFVSLKTRKKKSGKQGKEEGELDRVGEGFAGTACR